jgi:F-type H+-transporting ATPase subunit b
MEALLQALEGFLIGSIPTIVIFLLLWAIYNALVYKPLKRIRKERYDRTEGAVARARADIATAEAKTHQYEVKIRDAKLAIFKAQEEQRKQLAAARDAAIAEARAQSQQMVRESGDALQKELAAARVRLEQQADALAAEVIRSILRPVAAAPMGGRA